MTAAVHHRIDGPADGSALVLSNSLGATMSMWDPQIPALAQWLRVVRYDHRGHGGSPVPPGPYRLADLARDVLGLLDRLGLDRAHFCGLSLGGMIGMWLAANAPERIDRLVLCCTAADLPSQPWHDRAETVRADGTGAVASSVVERWFTPALRARDPELVRRSEAMVAATPPQGYAGCCDAIATMDVAGQLDRITAPTLVIAGADDPATPPEHAERIATAIRGARLEVIPGAAHLSNMEQAEAVTELILDHLIGDDHER